MRPTKMSQFLFSWQPKEKANDIIDCSLRLNSFLLRVSCEIWPKQRVWFKTKLGAPHNIEKLLGFL